MRIVPESRWISQAWKNGGGVTHEIVRWPAGADPYDVRISLARDERDAPFSTFPGYRRWSFLVGPAPITLIEPGRRIQLVAPGDHIELPGETALSCELPAGPTELFTVLARPGLCVAGFGAIAHPIRFRFVLGTREAAVFDPPEVADTRDAIWVS